VEIVIRVVAQTLLGCSADCILLVCGAAAQEWKIALWLATHSVETRTECVANFSIGSLGNRQLTEKIKYHRFALL